MKIKNGFAILRESWSVLKEEPSLMWFPILSGIAAIFLIATIILVGVMVPSVGLLIDELMAPFMNEGGSFSISHAIAIVFLFLVYIAEYFIVIYFNSALVYCALERFSGLNPTFSTGIRGANERLPQILAWAVVSAGVGALLAVIEERLGFIGTLVIKLIGVGWSIATYFVVPILVVEGLGPIKAVKRSAGILKKTWGEGLTGGFAIGLITFLSALMIIGAGSILAYVGMQLDSSVMIFGTMVVVILAILILSVVNSALHQIFLAGLYQFAVSGDVPSGFTEGTMRGALVKK